MQMDLHSARPGVLSAIEAARARWHYEPAAEEEANEPGLGELFGLVLFCVIAAFALGTVLSRL